jgi:hypothetical protein
MSRKRCNDEKTTAGDVVAFVVAVIVLGNGVLSALAGSWAPTIAAIGLIAAANWYNSLRSDYGD